MSIRIEKQKLLYHLTALDNIESILQNGLRARDKIENFTDIAEQDIIDFREKSGITNLIPFHFFIGTPFAGVVQKNHPDKEFVYIAIERNFAKRSEFKIFPTHPKHMKSLEIYEYEDGFEKIDWELMNKRDYNDYECKEVCMAECVATCKSINANDFQSIIVKSEETKKYIETLCEKIFNKKCMFYIDIKPWCFI